MGRNAYFDNAKLILIFLVVFGHMIQPFIDDSNAIHSLYTWMYTYHMPAFIFWLDSLQRVQAIWNISGSSLKSC